MSLPRTLIAMLLLGAVACASPSQPTPPQGTAAITWNLGATRSGDGPWTADMNYTVVETSRRIGITVDDVFVVLNGVVETRPSFQPVHVPPGGRFEGTLNISRELPASPPIGGSATFHYTDDQGQAHSVTVGSQYVSSLSIR